MTYRGPDPERALERAEEERAVREAAELDERAALRAIKKVGPALIVVRVVAGILIVVGSTFGGALLGAFVTNAVWRGEWAAISGLFVGFGVGLVVGVAALAFAVHRWAR